MSVINPLARELCAKIVYYGPGLSGKTTTLHHIYESVRPQRRGELVSLATEGDRTIFFDFLPLEVKQVGGMGVRFQLYTVPGQVFYEATRKLVLNGADGVVFVADSQEAALDANRQSFENLVENLEELDIDLATFPHVIQYNKRDLPSILSVGELSQHLNPHGAPQFETCATRGDGVLPALKAIAKLVIRSLWSKSNQQEQTRKRRSSNVELSVPESGGGIAASVARMANQTASVEMALPPETIPPPPMTEGLLSFTSLWEGADAAAIAEVESAIRDGDHAPAVELAAALLAELLESLPGTGAGESPMAKASLLGLDGTEYLRFCRLVGMPATAITQHDALFALYMLVSARLKADRI